MKRSYFSETEEVSLVNFYVASCSHFFRSVAIVCPGYICFGRNQCRLNWHLSWPFFHRLQNQKWFRQCLECPFLWGPLFSSAMSFSLRTFIFLSPNHHIPGATIFFQFIKRNPICILKLLDSSHLRKHQLWYKNIIFQITRHRRCGNWVSVELCINSLLT